jgi:heme exporter protein D
MSWASVPDFLAMGGYGLYVWGSLGMCAAVAAAEVGLIHLKRRALIRELKRESAADAGQSRA